MISLTPETKAYIKSVTKSKQLKPKKLSGYNIFSMEARKKMSGTSTEIMTQLGQLWKELTSCDREKYNTKAQNANKKAQDSFSPPEEDPQLKSLKKHVEDSIKEWKKMA